MLNTKLFKMERMRDRNIYHIVLIIFAILVFGSNPGNSWAKVEGICSNCHTMHNSQDDEARAISGGVVGWSGDDGQLTAIGSTDPNSLANLLITDCVGCHTSTDSDTIISVAGSSDIPIVYNTTIPTRPLAGGNFYWVAQGVQNDSMGHNVYGISAKDSALDQAPGKTTGAASPCSDIDGCHMSLAYKPSRNNLYRGGCQGCHVFVAHHDDSRPWYRFLKGHSSIGIGGLNPDNINGPDYVIRTVKSEDKDWEYTSDPNDHNYYKGTDNEYPGTGLDIYQTITAFCTGCHGNFHGPKRGTLGMGSKSPWIRHPSDIILPNTSEYADYDPVNDYSVEAPVAWLNPDNPIRDGAVVMCLSCHRAHGSDQPDLLRWDYDAMNAGGGGSGGCFTCHREKNKIP